MSASLPTGPIEVEPVAACHGLSIAEVTGLLDQAVDGLPLGAYDAWIIRWLKECDQPTIVTLASIIGRARLGSKGVGSNDTLGKGGHETPTLGGGTQSSTPLAGTRSPSTPAEQSRAQR